MKSRFAINPAKRSTSSARKGRRTSREVSRTAMQLIKDEEIANFDSQSSNANKRGRVLAARSSAGNVELVGIAWCSARLHGLSPLQACNANGVWRRADGCADHAGR